MDKHEKELLQRIGVDPAEEEKKKKLRSRTLYEKYKDKADQYDTVREALKFTGVDNWQLVKVSEEDVLFKNSQLYVSIEHADYKYNISLVSEDNESCQVTSEESFIESLKKAHKLMNRTDSRERAEEVADQVKERSNF